MLLAAGSFLSQMMLLVGMVMLAWILVRRNIKLRKNNRTTVHEIRQLEKNTASLNKSTPLADAPKEVLRWQASMFDLQRELKGELDTKIAVVQSLLRQVDQKVASLEAAGVYTHDLSTSRNAGISANSAQIESLSSAGLSAQEISEKLGISRAEVELSLSTQPAFHGSSEIM